MPATVRIPAKRSKYGNIRTIYNCRAYDSAAESKQAAELDILMKTGKIVDWTPQMPLRIVVNGTLICKLVVDFAVYTKSSKYFIEVKGHETAVYKLKLKLLKACYPDIDLRIVKA